MKRNRTTVVAVVALVTVAVLAYFAVDRWSPGPNAVAGVKGSAAPDASKASPGAAKGAAAAPIAVEVFQVKPTTVQEDLQAVGSLQSNESVILRPEVSGRIAAIGFKDGQVVRKGQMLIALDNALNEAEVAQMKAEYDLALANLKRSEDLASRKFISSSAQDTAASNAQVAEAKLKLAQARSSKMRIVAPFDGVVGIRGVSLGDYVKDGTDLVNVEDVRILKVDFRLPERNLTQIKVGQGIEVVADALPGERFAGRSTQSIRGSTPMGARWRYGRGWRTPAASCGPECSCACASSSASAPMHCWCRRKRSCRRGQSFTSTKWSRAKRAVCR